MPRLNLTGFFFIKLLAGFSIWAIYTYYYKTSDAFEYFKRSEIIYNTLYTHPIDYIKLLIGIDTDRLQTYYSKIPGWDASFDTLVFNDSRTMIRLNAFLRLFSFGNFHVHTVIMCFISFIGLTALYKTFIAFFKEKQMWLIFAIYFIPTVLYWSSGVLKESVLITGLGFLLYSTNCGLASPLKRGLFLLFILSLFILLSIKMYVLFFLFPALLSNHLYNRSQKTKLNYSYLLTYSVIIVCAIIMAFINPDYNILKIISDKQAKALSEAKGGIFLANNNHFICIDYDRNDLLDPINSRTYKIKKGSTYLQWSLENMQDTSFVNSSTDTSSFNLLYAIQPANSNLSFNKTSPTAFAFIKNIPFAIYHALFRSCFLTPNSVFELIAIIESQLILLFILLAFFFYKKPSESQLPIVWFCLVVSLSLLLLIGFTVPVLGAMIRYKLPALQFLVIALFLLIDFNKIKAKLSGSKPIFNVSADLK